VADERVSVTMNWRKWPSRLHWSAEVTLLRRDRAGLWLGTRERSPIRRPVGQPAAFASGESVLLCSEDVGWVARWYTHRGEAGRAYSYSCYVDITTPPRISDGLIELVDLDLDVALTWEGEMVVLDEDEFAEHSVSLGYPASLIEHARQACQEVQDRIVTGASPFGGDHVGLTQEWERSRAEQADQD